MPRVKIKRVLTRAFYYFKEGHSAYLMYFMSFAQWITIVYVLLISRIPILTFVFPHMWIFMVIFLFTYAPLAIAVGWFHFKKSPMYRAQLDVQVESNPYYYSFVPRGKEIPTTSLMIVQNRNLLKLFEKFNVLSEEDKNLMKKYIGLVEKLLEGRDTREFM
jgi:hypothetical protein